MPFMAPPVQDQQHTWLLKMTSALRSDLVLLKYVVAIKEAIADELYADAHGLWAELSEEEKSALWVAPKFGGIFTTEERKQLRRGS